MTREEYRPKIPISDQPSEEEEPKPTIDDALLDPESTFEAVADPSLPLMGLPPREDLEQVPKKFKDYIQTLVAFGRSNPSLGPKIRRLLHGRKALF